MKKIVSILMAVSIVAALFLGGCETESDTSASDTMTVTDTLGRTVTVPVNAETFVAIGPGCLRLYCYIAGVDQIVGVEQLEITNGDTGRPYAKANPELLDKQVIGPGGPNNSPDAEMILEVEPDVIFTTYNSDGSSVDELQNKTNIPVVALDYGGLVGALDPALNTSFELIGEITGNEARAAEVIQFFNDIEADLDDLRTSDIPFDDKPTVYYGAMSMRGTHGIESTSGDFSLFTVLNIRNVVEEAGTYEYVTLDKEALLDYEPEIIFIDGAGLVNVLDDYTDNQGYYNELTKNGEVYMLLPYNYYSTNLGTALADAYYIGSIVYPDEFSDVDVIAKANEIYDFLLGEELYYEVATEYYGGFQNLSWMFS